MSDFTEETMNRVVDAIWNDIDKDPHRAEDLLVNALGFMGAIALAPPWQVDIGRRRRAAQRLLQMEQRAIEGKP